MTAKRQVPDYAVLCLQALVDAGLGHAISLGGDVGLLHYLDYRPTHDVRAWGSDTRSERARLAVQTHLVRVALHRPLDEIDDAEQRREATALRTWFAGEFLDVLNE